MLRHTIPVTCHGCWWCWQPCQWTPVWSICQCSCTTLSCRVGSLIPTETETASKLPISTGGESEDKRGISHTNITVNLKQHQNCPSVQEGKVKTREVFLTQTLLSVWNSIKTACLYRRGKWRQERYFSHKHCCQSETASKLPISTEGESQPQTTYSSVNSTSNDSLAD